VGKFPFSASGKASAGGNKDGFVKVILMPNMVNG
jgi:dihydrolipoamide dehydrogenase